jgi:Uma2 family endonuclease
MARYDHAEGREAMATAELKEPLILGPELAGTLMTPEEFDAVEECDENWRYELIHGVLVVTPMPSASERSATDHLGHMLRTYRNQPQGAALDDTLPQQTVRTGNRRRADRVIWAGLGRQPDPRTDTPTIVAEFVSAGKRSRQRDYEEKREEYQEAGVAEYWLIDRFRRILTIFRPGQPAQVIREHERYTTPLLPGFELDLRTLLAAAERYSKQ